MNKKRLLTFIFSVSIFSAGFAQTWGPLGTGATSDWGLLTAATYNNELYVGGEWFYEAGNVPVNNIARWNGTSWNGVGSGLTGGQNYVAAMCVYQGKLYACGSFFAADGLPTNNIAVWDGSQWDTVTTKGLQYCGNGTGWADAMAIYNGKLYVAGAFCHAGGIKAENIACWDGTKWDSVSNGINDSVNALAVYNGKLYAGGQFTRAGKRNVSNIASWDGTKWDTVGTGTNAPVFALQAYSGSLYVGGNFTTAGVAAHFIAKWNDANWSAVGAGVTGITGVEAFSVFNGKLYVGGLFSKAGALTANSIASWNGTAWDTLSTQGINYNLAALTVYDSALYAAGQFTRAGTSDAIDVAVWGKVNTSGMNEVAIRVEDVLVYPNPGNGKFTFTLSHAELVSASHPIIELYDIFGKKVFVATLKQVQGDNELNISTEPSGIYFYRIVNESGRVINQGKLVKE